MYEAEKAVPVMRLNGRAGGEEMGGLFHWGGMAYEADHRDKGVAAGSVVT